MTSGIIADAAARADCVRGAKSLRAFRHAARDFTAVLSVVPDEPAGSLSADGVCSLQILGQEVIDLIEQRLEGDDVGRAAQELASDIYEIRRLLEEAVRRRQHYAVAGNA